MRAVGLLLAVSACGNSCQKQDTVQAVACGVSAAPDANGNMPTELYAIVDLPRIARTRELSGTALDESTHTLYALEDKRPWIVSLVASPTWRTWTLGPRLTLSYPLALTHGTHTGYFEDAWDGEGLVRTSDGSFFVIANERAPAVAKFDAHGVFIEKVEMPEHYSRQAPNKGLESLSLSPDERYLFTANEGSLLSDGPPATKTRGTLVRILRRELASSKDEEFAYRTEPLGGGKGGDMGVSELAAISGDDLLVLERGFQHGYGNTVRVFRVNLAGAKNVIDVPSLDDSVVTLEKTLVLDVGNLQCSGATHRGPERNPVLENFEAMTIGPVLPDGRRLLFLTSDDNGRSDQVPRIVIVAVKLHQ
ncbi:esterase-like activity of phytase family protein [Pendulispora brunnea]|uniref:Esterase-like activity of phytase family protein n=1 Tax=Pendulispora brunnea TaxID=2905690 RepID=A0ABZ2K0L5_9BACT